MSGKIQVLPTEVANRIAAGEVVERPASIVKELVENALDAGAKTLDIDLEEGGIRLVRVRDDGGGMSEEDLRTAILPHATSKIASVDDLFRIASFGFRGEALPSIASVSETTITTRRPDEDGGFALHTEGGEDVVVKPAAHPPGTTVEVRNLFFNVPARRHFLKQARTELGQCLETITRLLLPEPGVAARITHEGKRVLEVEADADQRGRLRTLFGAALEKRLLQAEGEDGDLRVEAYVGPPDLVRATGRQQYLFLNGRHIKDRTALHALRDAFRGLIMPKEHPVGFVFLDMDPAGVDVNVHPTKTEVRFRERDRVFSLIRRTIRRVLDASYAPRELSPTAEGEDFPASTIGSSEPTQSTASLATEAPPEAPREIAVQERFAGTPAPPPSAPATVKGGKRPRIGTRCSALSPDALRGLPRGDMARHLQVHRSYVVVEADDGLEIIDQHALHERRLYEELLTRFRKAEGEVQNLLVPEVVDLAPAEVGLLSDRAEELAEAGVRLEAFGPSSVALHALPLCVVGKVRASDVVDTALEALEEGGRERIEAQDFIEKTLAGLACRAAVKFGDRLPEAELRALLAWGAEHPEARNCPHGRPVAVQVTMAELENRFLRKK